MRNILLLLAGLAVSSSSALATTLIPITFDEQIAKADRIFRGRVESIEPRLEASGTGRRVVTKVTFVPSAVYKGENSASVELTFLGGRVGDVEMHVDGMPEFEKGREYVVFATGDPKQACPVIGWSEGSLPYDPQTGEVRMSEHVAEELTVRSSSTLRAAAVNSAGPSNKLGLASFEAALRARIQEVSSQ